MEEAYRQALKIFERDISKEEFLRIFQLQFQNIDEYRKEREKLTIEQQGAFTHIAVAYRRLLRERGEL